MREIYEALRASLGSEETAALATIVHTRGSTPRKAGAKMLILPSGKTVGTVGGGCVEAGVWQEAKEVMETGRPKLLDFNLAADPPEGRAGDEGMVCGGSLKMFIEPISARTDTW